MAHMQAIARLYIQLSKCAILMTKHDLGEHLIMLTDASACTVFSPSILHFDVNMGWGLKR